MARELAARGERFALATVVRVARPMSGKPGDKATVRETGEKVGFVGGSCSGTSVMTEGLKAIREGQPRPLRLTPAAGLETATPLKVDHEGARYCYCSEMCRTRFLESPATFLS